MNIGLIIYGRLDTLTGGYIYDRMLVERLRQDGHRVEIVSLPRQHYTRHLLDNVSPELLSKLVSADFDLLLQDELNHPSLFKMNHRLRKMSDIPIVAIVHQVLCRQPRNGLLNSLYEIVERSYLNSVDAFIFNSNTTRQTVEQLVHDRRPSIVAFPAGDRLGCLASPAQAASRARTLGPLRLMFVGNVLPNKGLLPLIQSLLKLSFETWHLTVVGSLQMDCRYLRKVEKLIVAKNMKQQIALVGPKEGVELASLLEQSHVFVMPYSHEGFGMAHLEAMGFALPVIGSSSGAVKEFVIPEQNGFLIDPGDVKATRACLKRLDHDRQLLIKMSHAALKTFHEQPRWSDTMEAVHRFLSDLVNDHRKCLLQPL
ncbi:MAG: glycosyltransferase family 4 protein [Desulfobacterales bacterium]|jgi:glycosyltransferase involved in cell wall biosynthesis